MRKISKILAFFCLTTMLLVFVFTSCDNGLLSAPPGFELPPFVEGWVTEEGEDPEYYTSNLIGKNVPSNIIFESASAEKDKKTGFLTITADQDIGESYNVGIANFSGFGPDHFIRYKYLVINTYLGNIKLADTNLEGDAANVTLKFYSETDKSIDLESYLVKNESGTISYIVPTSEIGNGIYAMDLMFGGAGRAIVKSVYLLTDEKVNTLFTGGFNDILAEASTSLTNALVIDPVNGPEPGADNQYTQAAIDTFTAELIVAQDVCYKYDTYEYKRTEKKRKTAQVALDKAANKFYKAYIAFKAQKVFAAPTTCPVYVPSDAVILYSSRAGRTGEFSGVEIWGKADDEGWGADVEVGIFYPNQILKIEFLPLEVGQANWMPALLFNKTIHPHTHLYASFYTKLPSLGIGVQFTSEAEKTSTVINNTGKYKWVSIDIPLNIKKETAIKNIYTNGGKENEIIYLESVYAYIPKE